MKAWVLHGIGDFRIEEQKIPVVGNIRTTDANCPDLN